MTNPPRRECRREARRRLTRLKPPVAARRPVRRPCARHRANGRLCVAARRQLAGRSCATGRRWPADIRAYLEAENAYTAAAMADARGCAQRSSRRCAAASRRTIHRSRRPTAPLPMPRATRTAPSTRCSCARRATAATETVLLDANAMPKGKAYFRLGGAAHSPDHSSGLLQSTTRARNFHASASATPRPARTSPTPSRTTGGAASGRRRQDAVLRLARRQPSPGRCCRHTSDEPRGRRRRLRGSRSRLLHRRRQDQSRPLHHYRTPRPRDVGGPRPRGRRPEATPRLVADAQDGAGILDLDHGGDRFYILTNADGAEDFKIVTAPIATPDRRTGGTSFRTGRAA